jgi:serine/threonine-protein kinase
VTPEPDDPAVLAVAMSVSDGEPIDLSDAGATARTLEDPALLRELQVLARIADVHRSPAQIPLEASQEDIPRRWGHLEIRSALGSGSFGTVYRAHDPRLQRDVALKIYKTRGLLDSHLTSLFAEGRLLARVRHPNVVVVLGVERHADEVGLWLELIDGRTLADEVCAGGPLGFREAVLVGQDICRALAAVHQAGLVHGDVKPQNVMRERGGRIVLMDFGIGRDLRRGPTAVDRVGGTPLYMAPEIFEGERASVASDIYSLGVLLFFLVTGSHPVLSDSRAGLEQSHREGRRRLLRDLRSDLPDPFVDVVDRACAPDPAQRYATAGALQAALSAVLSLSSETTSVSRSAAGSTRSMLRPGWMALAAAALLAVTAGGFVALRPWRPEPPAVVNAPTPPDGRAQTGLADPDQYQIRAVFHRKLPSGSEPLTAGARVAPGNALFLEIDATRPVHVYVVNQDERGESFLLFPLPGQAVANPLSAGKVHRLPGDFDWEVTSAGGREHFLLVASPEPLGALAAVFARLPTPQVGGPATRAAPLTQDEVGQLRGIGGLSPRTAQGPAGDLLRSAVALGSDRETVKGPWMRQFTLENPAR